MLLEVTNRDIISAIAEKLDVTLLNYCNSHATRVQAPMLGGPPKEQTSQDILAAKKLTTKPVKDPLKKATGPKSLQLPKQPLQKKITGLNLQAEQEQCPPLIPYILQDYMSEVIYSDLLAKLLIFDSNIQDAPGLWRN